MTQNTFDHATSSRGNARGRVTRLRLLDAALQAFARRGFHGTGTRDIADAAGMSPAAVYAHYQSKEQLLFEISLAGHREVRQLVHDAMARSTEPAVQLREVVRAFTAWHAREQMRARVVQYEMPALTPEHASEIAHIRRDIEAAMRRLLTAGSDTGDFRVVNPRVVALAVLSLGIDVARWYRADGAWTPEEIGDHYADLALRMVRASPA